MNIEIHGIYRCFTPGRPGSRLHRVPSCRRANSARKAAAGSGGSADHPVIQVLRSAAANSPSSNGTSSSQPLEPIERLPANSWTTAASQQQALTIQRLRVNAQTQQQTSSETPQQQLQQQLQQQQQTSTATSSSRTSQTGLLASTQTANSNPSSSTATHTLNATSFSTASAGPSVSISTSSAVSPAARSTSSHLDFPDDDRTPASTAWARTTAAAQQATALAESQQIVSSSSSSGNQPMMGVIPSGPELPWQLPASQASSVMSNLTVPVLVLSLFVFGLKWFLGGGAAPKEEPKIWPTAPKRTPLTRSTSGAPASLSPDGTTPPIMAASVISAAAAAAAGAATATPAITAVEGGKARESKSSSSSSSRGLVKPQPGWWRGLATLHYIDFGPEFGVLPWVRGDPIQPSEYGDGGAGEASGSPALTLVGFQDAADAQFVSEQVVQFMLAAILPGEVDSEQLIRSLRPSVKSLSPLLLESMATRQGQGHGNLGVVPSKRLDKTQMFSESQLQEGLSELVSCLRIRPAVKAAPATANESPSEAIPATSATTAVQMPMPAPSTTSMNSDPWAQPRITPSKLSLSSTQAVSSNPVSATAKATASGLTSPPTGAAKGGWTLGPADFPGFDDPPPAAAAAAAAATPDAGDAVLLLSIAGTQATGQTGHEAMTSAVDSTSAAAVSSQAESVPTTEPADSRDGMLTTAHGDVEGAKAAEPVVASPPVLRFSFSKKRAKTFASAAQASTASGSDPVISSISNPNLMRPQQPLPSLPVQQATPTDASVTQASTPLPFAAAAPPPLQVQQNSAPDLDSDLADKVTAEFSRTLIDSTSIEVQMPEDEEPFDADTEQLQGQQSSSRQSDGPVVAAEYADVPAELLPSDLQSTSETVLRDVGVDPVVTDRLVTVEVEQASMSADADYDSDPDVGEAEQGDQDSDPDLDSDMLQQYYDLEESDAYGDGTATAEAGSMSEGNMDATGQSYAQSISSQGDRQTSLLESEEVFRRKAVTAVASLLGTSPNADTQSAQNNAPSLSDSNPSRRPTTASSPTTIQHSHEAPSISSPTSPTINSTSTVLASIPIPTPTYSAADDVSSNVSNAADSSPTPLQEHVTVIHTASVDEGVPEQLEHQRVSVSAIDALKAEMTSSQRQLALVMGRMAVARVQGQAPPATARQELQQLQRQMAGLKAQIAAAVREDEPSSQPSASESDSVDPEPSSVSKQQPSKTVHLPESVAPPQASFMGTGLAPAPDTATDAGPTHASTESSPEEPPHPSSTDSRSGQSISSTALNSISSSASSSTGSSSTSSSIPADNPPLTASTAADIPPTPQHADPTPPPSPATPQAIETDSSSSSSSSSSGVKRAASKASGLGGKSGWGSWSRNSRISKAGVSLLKHPLTAGSTPPTASSIATVTPHQSPGTVDAAAAAVRDILGTAGISSHPLGSLAEEDTETLPERDEDGVVVYSRGVGKVRPKKVERAPEDRQATVKNALRFVASSSSSNTAVDPLDDDEAEYGRPAASSRSKPNSGSRSGSDGRVRVTPSATSASLMEGVEGAAGVAAPQWWQRQFQMLWIPNVSYSDGTDGFVQLDVSLDESVRDARVLCFEDRHDCVHCLAILKQWPEYDWCKFSVASMSTSNLEQSLRTIHEQQAELNDGVGKPAGVVVFRRGKLAMRVGMDLEEFTQRVVWQAAAQLSLSSVGYQFDD